MEKYIKKCPLCNSEAIFGNIGNSQYRIKCLQCGLMITADRSDKVIEWWNTRYNNPNRELIAAMAMQGLLSNPEYMTEYEGSKYLLTNTIIAEVAIKQADELIKQLEIIKIR